MDSRVLHNSLTIIIHDPAACGISIRSSIDGDRNVIVHDSEKQEEFLIQLIDIIINDGHFDSLFLTEASSLFKY